MNPQIVGKQITAHRKAMGLTQKELAEKLLVTDGAVSKWERGINFPDVSLLEPLAAELGTTVIELLELETATKQEVISAVTDISEAEKQKLKKDLKSRSIFKIAIELLLMAALITASKIFDNYQIYGLAQICTMGMMGFVGTLIGSELFLLRNLKKL